MHYFCLKSLCITLNEVTIYVRLFPYLGRATHASHTAHALIASCHALCTQVSHFSLHTFQLGARSCCSQSWLHSSPSLPPPTRHCLSACTRTNPIYRMLSYHARVIWPTCTAEATLRICLTSLCLSPTSPTWPCAGVCASSSSVCHVQCHCQHLVAVGST